MIIQCSKSSNKQTSPQNLTIIIIRRKTKREAHPLAEGTISCLPCFVEDVLLAQGSFSPQKLKKIHSARDNKAKSKGVAVCLGRFWDSKVLWWQRKENSIWCRVFFFTAARTRHLQAVLPPSCGENENGSCWLFFSAGWGEEHRKRTSSQVTILQQITGTPNGRLDFLGRFYPNRMFGFILYC